MDLEHWRSMREIFGDPDLGLPPSDNVEANEEYARGLSLIRDGNASGGVQAFQRADELGHAGAARELGLLAGSEGDMELAGPFLARARERGDGRAAAHLGLLRPDEPDQMLEDFRFSDKSGDSEGSRNLGLALKARGDLTGAEAALRRSDERGSPSGSLALGLFLRDERGDLDGAEAALRRAEQRGHPKGALNLVDLYGDRGDTAAAEAARERTLELSQKHRTVFREMQTPDFIEYVRRSGRSAGAAAGGSGCVVAILVALLMYGAAQ